jgi:hypothetical protein
MSSPECIVKDGERSWQLWNLTEGTIKAIAKHKGLPIVGKDFGEIARVTKKGIDAALDFVWEEAIENAIKNTGADWKFEVLTSGRVSPVNQTWRGDLGCKSEGVSFVVSFELSSPMKYTDLCVVAAITSIKPDMFIQAEWDDLVDAMTGFIETTYRAEHWV